MKARSPASNEEVACGSGAPVHANGCTRHCRASAGYVLEAPALPSTWGWPAGKGLRSLRSSCNVELHALARSVPAGGMVLPCQRARGGIPHVALAPFGPRFPTAVPSGEHLCVSVCFQGGTRPGGVAFSPVIVQVLRATTARISAMLQRDHAPSRAGGTSAPCRLASWETLPAGAGALARIAASLAAWRGSRAALLASAFRLAQG